MPKPKNMAKIDRDEIWHVSVYSGSAI